MDTTPELVSCPVRKRFLWRIVRYGLPVARWQRGLAQAARGTGNDRAVHRLRAFLCHAERSTDYYPSAFFDAGVTSNDLRAFDDLQHFPSLTRTALQANHHLIFDRRISPADLDEGFLGATSGSTGEPVRFFMDGPSIHFFPAFVRFLWRQFNCGTLPRPGSTGIVLLCTLPRSAIYENWMPLFRATRFRKLHWRELNAARTLSRLAPAVITGDPDSLALLADAIETHDVTVRPRLILSSAFTLPDNLTARLEAATGAVVLDTYSIAETGPLAYKCRRTGEFHLLDAVTHVENIGGEVVVTNFRNRFFPLVRYHTGDIGAVLRPDAPCACGVFGPRLARLSGRIAARFIARDGRRVDPSQTQPLVSRLAVRQFQFVQESLVSVRFRYFAEAPLPDDSKTDLERAIASLLGGPTRLTLEWNRAPLFRPGEKPIVYVGGGQDPTRHISLL